MLDTMIKFFMSAFDFPGLHWTLVLLAILIGLFFGACWLAPYWPPLFKRSWLWLMGLVGALLTWIAIAFIQIPMQAAAGGILRFFWDDQTLVDWILLAGIPQILCSGLVQEGSKLVPVVFFWWRNNRNISAVLGLTAGAVVGVGFGVFEAIWINNSILASGWTWNTVAQNGFPALMGFWERFFSVGLHVAVSALAGYGLAKGMGWQFYLIASFLHAAANYSIVLMTASIFNAISLEIYIAVLTLAIAAVALWLRWRKPAAADSAGTMENIPDNNAVT
jgi:RsiW-degrading membrane proteinase PrsW (M82 family)